MSMRCGKGEEVGCYILVMLLIKLLSLLKKIHHLRKLSALGMYVH